MVVDERTLLATAEGTNTGMEGWRPLMGTCSQTGWSWEVHTEAWASEWRENKQFPFFEMADFLQKAISHKDNKTLLWPKVCLQFSVSRVCICVLRQCRP